MADKMFYQAAAAEVSEGKIDPALWIKVHANMPEASNMMKQAKYIQMRAQEMALENKITFARRFLPNSPRMWTIVLLIGLLIVIVIASMGDSQGAVASAILVFILLLVAVITWRSMQRTKVSGGIKFGYSETSIITPPQISPKSASSFDETGFSQDSSATGAYKYARGSKRLAQNDDVTKWLLCLACAIIGAIILLAWQVYNKDLQTDNIRFMLGTLFGYLLAISLIPLLFSIITLFRKPRLATAIVCASFSVVMLVTMAGNVTKQSLAENEPNHTTHGQNDPLALKDDSQSQGTQEQISRTGKPTDLHDSRGWNIYLGTILDQNLQGMTASQPFAYLVTPAMTPIEQGQSDRKLRGVQDTVERGVLPGNLVAFAGPVSSATADFVVAAFRYATPGSFNGVIILFIGEQADSERVRKALVSSGAIYRFAKM